MCTAHMHLCWGNVCIILTHFTHTIIYTCRLLTMCTTSIVNTAWQRYRLYRVLSSSYYSDRANAADKLQWKQPESGINHSLTSGPLGFHWRMAANDDLTSAHDKTWFTACSWTWLNMWLESNRSLCDVLENYDYLHGIMIHRFHTVFTICGKSSLIDEIT